jgi:hypothetical protein
MPYLFSLLHKFARYLTGTRATKDSVMEFQNSHIFPRPPRADRGPFDHRYPPDDLRDIILGDRDAVDGIGHVYISSAKYCKNIKGAQHEFLVFLVKDNTCARRNNTLIIDRVPSSNRLDNRDTPPRNVNDLTDNDRLALRGEPDTNNSSIFDSSAVSSEVPSVRGNVISSSEGSLLSDTRRPALDTCRVSGSGDFEGMARRSGLTPNQCIAELTFHDNSFTLEMLLTLAHTLSTHKPHYDIFKTQCYWYSFMLWELMQRVTGTTATTSGDRTPGSHTLVPWLQLIQQGSERQRELDKLFTEYQTQWDNFLVELPRWKRVSYYLICGSHS